MPLTKGFFAVISAVDAAAVGRFNWCAAKDRNTTYAARTTYAEDGTQGRERLHQFIGHLMGLDLAVAVDHENGNGLDCRRSNLRDATSAQNAANAKRSARNTSGVKGVSWYRKQSKWTAEIDAGGERHYLGRFDTIEEAAAVVAAARDRLHGEFANHGGNS